MRKFTESEADEYRKKYDAAIVEVDANYREEIDTETARLQAEIDAAKEEKNPDRRKAAQAELREYEKHMAELKAREARQLLKERFDYPIFLYDAKRVGITSTGEQGACELFHSETLGLPSGMQPEETTLVEFQRFRKDPERFIREALASEGRE